MITNEREKKICDKYSARDKFGYDSCYKCPLRKFTWHYDYKCKANSYYNKHSKTWVWDDEE